MPETEKTTHLATELADVREDYRATLAFIEKMEQLAQFQDKIDFPATIDRIWQVLLTDIHSTIQTDVCALFLVDPDTHEFVLDQASPRKMADACRREIDLQIECGTFSWVINRRQPALIPSLAFKSPKTVVMLPLSTVKRTLGSLLVVTSIGESLITRESMRLLTLLAKQCSLVLENTMLYERLSREHKSLEKANAEIRKFSVTDALTGCYNRGYLMERLPQEIKKARRYGHPMALILSDIDHFKLINDTYGHQAGDQVLQEFVKCLTRLIRVDIDWLARYGGEEFLIVLPETTLDGAIRLAERLRHQVSLRKMRVLPDRKIQISASFGVTDFDAATPEEKASVEFLVGCADYNLYRAKESGRNRVCGSHSTLMA